MTNWTQKDVISFLSQMKLFENLPDNVPQTLAEKVIISQFSDRATVLKRGQGGNSLYIVAAGQVKVTLDSPKGKQEVSVLDAGEFFGEIAMMTQARRTATVTAIGDTIVLECLANDILPLADKHPDLKKRIVRVGAKRSQDSLSRLIDS